jgi:hypothetical protein
MRHPPSQETTVVSIRGGMHDDTAMADDTDEYGEIIEKKILPYITSRGKYKYHGL